MADVVLVFEETCSGCGGMGVNNCTCDAPLPEGEPEGVEFIRCEHCKRVICHDANDPSTGGDFPCPYCVGMVTEASEQVSYAEYAADENRP